MGCVLSFALTLVLSVSAFAKQPPAEIDTPIQALRLLTQLQDGSSENVQHRLGHTDFERWSKEGYRLLAASFKQNDAGPMAFENVVLFKLVNGDGSERSLSYYVKDRFLSQTLEGLSTTPLPEEDVATLAN